MNPKCALLMAAALLLLVPPLLPAQTEEAQEAAPAPPPPPPPPPRPVNIQLLAGQGTDPREITVAPNASAVCRRTLWERLNCPLELNFRWTGPPGNPGEKIQVFYYDGVYLDQGAAKKVAASECFVFPGNQNPFTLEHGPANGRNIVFRQNHAGCPSKVAFFYDISCVGGDKNTCGGVETLDPATIADNGRR